MSHQNCALSSLIKRACRKSCSNFQRGNEEVERWKFGNQSIAFLKPIPNHSSDVNQSFTHWIIARQETKVEIGSRLPRHKSLSAWQSMVTKAEAWSPREEVFHDERSPSLCQELQSRSKVGTWNPTWVKWSYCIRSWTGRWMYVEAASRSLAPVR